jgi:2-dehydro-3-deoxyglucarate aldolase
MNSLSKKLKKGELTLGSWITLAHPSIAEIMAKSGFDWLAVDLEHSVITIREAEELIRIIDLCGVVPLVRLTSNNPDLIKRVMDAGSHGVIVPMVNSVAEAEKAVQAVKYPTRGKRGFGLARAQGYGPKFREYLEWQDENSVIIVQIEHIEAVKNLEAILAVDGIDGYIIGPYDLSGSMGIPGQFEHPDLLAALDTISNVAKKLGKPGGIHIVEPEPALLRNKIEEGQKFIAYSVDIRIIDVACRAGLNEVKELRK